MITDKLRSRAFDSHILWHSNIIQEQVLARSPLFPTIVDSIQESLVQQQEQQQLFLSEPEDCIMAHSLPDHQFLEYLSEQGFRIPKFVLVPGIENGGSKPGYNHYFVPYLVTENMERLAQENCLILFGPSAQLSMQLNDKYFIRKMLISNGITVTKGGFCHSAEELTSMYRQLKNEGFDKVVIKLPFGSSGKGLRMVDNEGEFHSFIKYSTKRVKNFELLVEGWHPHAYSLNAQVLIHKHHVIVLGVTEQIIQQDSGSYLGTNFLPDPPENIRATYIQEMKRIGKLLSNMGYSGIFGVDSIVDRNGTIFPVIEINARLTQVTYLLSLVRRLSKSYAHIESRNIRLVEDGSRDFQYYLQLFNQLLKSNEVNRFLIYTFAKHVEGDKGYFRIFVLFYGNDRAHVRSMVEEFQSIGI
ncbi:ATP-grasp domain-containing protein [Paenibacillus glucanolyticus]|uniref:ATP-grasp domain-containing protein n=1 Tax=Paenibacillus glucanolyticus TaxID=59843 RepID=UPI0036C8F679